MWNRIRAARFATVVLALATLMALAPAPVAAQWDRRGNGWGNGSRSAYDTGYREGWNHGEKDARQGRDFAFAHAKEYQRADKGYNRRDGDIDWYRREFRRGYEFGYRDGYSRQGGGRGRYSGYGRNSGYGSTGGYGSPGGYGGGYYSPALQNGLNDGYEKGLEDARDRDPFDPARHKWYREGDRHYNSRYGPRDAYKNEYRQGFRQGYERGYREAAGYYGGYGRSGRRPSWWPF